MDDTVRPAGGEVIEAATVVLLRDLGGGVETLMLRKNAGQSFGGMWVFPGGKVEATDGDGPAGLARAAVREAFEETGLVLDTAELIPFAHWLPPEEAPRRFSTWFFVGRLPEAATDVVIDGGEIGDQMWTTPGAALDLHAAGSVALAPPTWVTLWDLADAGTIDDALAAAAAGGVRSFSTHMAQDDTGTLVCTWAPDAGYETGDLTAPGPRHRLRMVDGGWTFERG